MKSAKKNVCALRRPHFRTTAIRRGGMPEPESFDTFLGLDPRAPVAVEVAVEVEVEVAVEVGVGVVVAPSRLPTIPTLPVFHGIGSTSGCSSANTSGDAASFTAACGTGCCCATSDLLHAQALPAHRAEASLLAHREIVEVLALLADEGAAIGVRGDLIDRRDDGVHVA